MKRFGGLLLSSLIVVGCANEARNDSIKASNAGNEALNKKQFDTAIDSFEKATQRYNENHLAWYGLGSAHVGNQEWAEAALAFDKAVNLAPDQPMYQMWDGIAQYEKAVSMARESLATREGKKPEDVQPDLAAINYDLALQRLQEAVKLAPDMWRANYYIGKIYRNTEKPQEAAQAFTKAISGNPRESGPYIALAELYRQWDYTEQAVAVASAGADNVPGAHERSDLEFVLGMGYDDMAKKDDAGDPNNQKAIDAFTKALADEKGMHIARFQRGQTYFRMGKLDDAKKDLEEFSKSGSKKLEFIKSQANKLLMDIAVKKAGPPADAPK